MRSTLTPGKSLVTKQVDTVWSEMSQHRWESMVAVNRIEHERNSQTHMSVVIERSHTSCNRTQERLFSCRRAPTTQLSDVQVYMRRGGS